MSAECHNCGTDLVGDTFSGLECPVCSQEERAIKAESSLADAVGALERLSDSTEMAGMGETEHMTGPAAVELRTRMKTARDTLKALYAQHPELKP